MARKKLELEAEEEKFFDEEESVELEPEPQAAEEPSPAVQEYYKPVKWKGVLDTFRCETCQTCLENEDEMILHVAHHAPAAERETLLSILIEFKKKEK